MELTCIVCPVGCRITVDKKDGAYAVSGNQCPRGRDFALMEATDPRRSLSSTVKTTDPTMPRLPVRTDGEIPRDMIFPVMALINETEVNRPVHMGDVIIADVLGTGVNIISTCDM
jgi:CxxC motif-containing protein